MSSAALQKKTYGKNQSMVASSDKELRWPTTTAVSLKVGFPALDDCSSSPHLDYNFKRDP